MSSSKIQNLYQRLCTLTVFRGVLTQPVTAAFMSYAACRGLDRFDTESRLSAYSTFVAEIYRAGGDLSACVGKAVFEDENVYVIALAEKREVPREIVASAERELAILSELASLTAADFEADLAAAYPVAGFASQKTDLCEAYHARIEEIGRYGYGIFSSAGMFRLSDTVERKIEPIVSADPVTIDSFIGYREERERVLANTRAFAEGKSAANVLLYGDAGTGKSSTVKAVANHFYDRGIRLIEIRKDQMSMLPFVMEKINRNPLRFIIFIDDLSFNRNDDTFSMLKAALEGSASAKASNAVIYATSNRRHIVRETFDDREGSDVHRNDTMQELLSLSARFGLSIQFGKPNKALYLEIVHELAKKKGIDIDPAQLDVQAEAFALGKGHRSARCAEQFIDSLL